MFDNRSGQPYCDAASDVDGSIVESMVVTEASCSMSVLCKSMAPVAWSAVAKEHREPRSA